MDSERDRDGPRRHSPLWRYAFSAGCFFAAFQLAWLSVDVAERPGRGPRMSIAVEGLSRDSRAALDAKVSVEVGRASPILGCPNKADITVDLRPRAAPARTTDTATEFSLWASGDVDGRSENGITFRRTGREGVLPGPPPSPQAPVDESRPRDEPYGGEFTWTPADDWRRAMRDAVIEFEADWVESRSFGSCWVPLPIVDSEASPRPSPPEVRTVTVEIEADAVSMDASEPPPTTRHNVWRCQPRGTAEPCGGLALVQAPWQPLMVNLALLFAGVLLSLGVEFWVRAFFRE